MIPVVVTAVCRVVSTRRCALQLGLEMPMGSGARGRVVGFSSSSGLHVLVFGRRVLVFEGWGRMLVVIAVCF